MSLFAGPQDTLAFEIVESWDDFRYHDAFRLMLMALLNIFDSWLALK
jgi:hypothetical protein